MTNIYADSTLTISESCNKCGAWIPPNTYHVCNNHQAQSLELWQVVNLGELTRIANALEKIAELLESKG